MTMRRTGLLLSAVLAAACNSVEPYDYTLFREHPPRSILVLPPLNNSLEVDASYSYLSTVTQPLAEQGYYVFPVAVVDALMRENGLPTPGEMHTVSLDRIADIFGADSVLLLHWLAAAEPKVDLIAVHVDHGLRGAESDEDARFAGHGASVCRNLDDDLGRADIVIAATMATEPLVRGDALKAGAHVGLVGSFTPEMREGSTCCRSFSRTRGTSRAPRRRSGISSPAIPWTPTRSTRSATCSPSAASVSTKR